MFIVIHFKLAQLTDFPNVQGAACQLQRLGPRARCPRWRWSTKQMLNVEHLEVTLMDSPRRSPSTANAMVTLRNCGEKRWFKRIPNFSWLVTVLVAVDHIELEKVWRLGKTNEVWDVDFRLTRCFFGCRAPLILLWIAQTCLSFCRSYPRFHLATQMPHG